MKIMIVNVYNSTSYVVRDRTMTFEGKAELRPMA